MPRVGIVGVGKLGTYHCNALMQLPQAELVAVYDVNPEQAQTIAKKFQCTAMSSAEALVDAVDVVGVIVPTTHHLETAKIALQQQKAVFVEKPIAATVAEAEEMVDLARTNNAPLQVGHIERFNPALQSLDTHNWKPRFIESHRLAPFNPRGTDVAVILDLMIHDIDIILSMVKSPLKDLRASGVAIVSDEADIANARLEFENGCVANMTASRISQRKMRKMRIFQNDMYISIDFLQRTSDMYQLLNEGDARDSTIHLGEIDKGKYKKQIVYRQPAPAETDAMQSEWLAFFDAIENNRTPIVSGYDGLEALRVAMNVLDLIKAGNQ